MMKFLIGILAVGALVVGLFFGPSLRSEDPVVRIRPARGEAVSFSLWVADTPEEQAHGLQGVASLDADRGMWFVYDAPRALSYWMKDTLIPLDILFVDENLRIVTMHENVPPCVEVEATQTNCPVYPSEVPARYVLELNGGTARTYGIRIGDFFIFLNT